MKKFFHAALVLPLLLFAVSCSESNDDGGDDKPVKLSPDTKLEQQVYADEPQAPAPIKFTATAPWTATVAAVPTKAEGGSEVDWLTLSAYKGGAGDASLTATLLPNYTGADRKAEIRIVCNDKAVVLTVEQKGMKRDGSKPEDPNKPTGYALVESIDARFWVGCKEEAATNDYSSSFHYVFRYDDQNRIAEYELADHNYTGNGTELDYKHTTRFDYTNPGEIRLTEHTVFGPNSDDEPYTKTYRIQLDDQGRATQIKMDGGGKEDITYYTYNNEDRLSRFSWYESDSSSELSYEDMTYQNGVISKVLIHEPDRNDREIIFPADAFSDKPNDRLSIDPNWLLFTEPLDPEYMLPMLRLAGKGCDRLTLWLPNDEEDNMPASPPTGWPEPNVTIHQTFDYYKHETTGRLQYTFNDDGTFATITQPIVCIQMRCEYDIVVGNEPFIPHDPNSGYKATIKNEKRTELKRSTDKDEWTFTYRK